MGTKRTRVAILGGGCGAMTAAHYLTATAALRERYEVTVYQQGWRLGGKGASGRNSSAGERIEEHGLHMFMGFYEEAFSLMRATYDEWVPPPKSPIRSFDDAFKPQYQVSVTERVSAAPGWYVWNITLPELPGEPGTGVGDPTHHLLLQRAVGWLEAQVEELARKVETTAHQEHHWYSQLVDGRHPSLSALSKLAAKLVEEGKDASSSAIEQSLQHLADALEWVLNVVAAIGDENNPTFRHILLVLRLGIAGLTGFLTDVFPYGEAGFQRINHLDFKDWLAAHGASPDVAWSAPVQAFYDMAFAYVDGKRDRAHAQAAAGAVLKALMLMMLGYKKAPLWSMQAGMGDTIFSPLYDVLRARGVKFKFFHRVSELSPSTDGTLVESITVQRQANVRYEIPYQPLRYVKDLPCWPSEPDWDQLVDGDKLRAAGVNFESHWCDYFVEEKQLHLGTDFDEVVLGISVAALAEICKPLFTINPRFSEMFTDSNTVQTCAAQLWLEKSTAELGWSAGPTVLTAYETPDASWADMSHLLARECWPSVQPTPRSLQYLCGVFPDPAKLPPRTDTGYPARAHREVYSATKTWLSAYPGLLWPNASTSGGGLQLEQLYRPDGGTGEDRLNWQYVRVNIDPTERYVLTVPGTVAARLAPGESGFTNVVLAGDWTKTRLNAGCAESAIESGHEAAKVMISR